MRDLIDRQVAIDALNNWFFNSTDERLPKQVIEALPSAEPERPPEIQDILNYLDTVLHPIISPEHWDVYSELHDMISALPSVQPEPDINDVTCDNCDYSEKFVGGLILCRRTKTSHRVSATSTCGKGKREVEDAETKV